MITVLYNQGAQTIRAVPMDRVGAVRVVSSATYSIVDLRQPEDGSLREVVASTAATLSTVSTTIAAAAGPSTTNPRALTLTDATGVRVGGVYLLRDSTGAVEESATVARIVSAAVELTRPLTRAFANGASFLGVEIEGSFPLAVANDEERLKLGGGPFQVTWVYTLDSVLHVRPDDIWLTRYGTAPWVRPDQVYQFFPGIAGYVGEQVDPGQSISAATLEYEELVFSSGRDPVYLRGRPSSTLFVAKRALVHMLRGSRAEALLGVAADFAIEAQTHANNLLMGKPPVRTTVVDHDTDTAAAGGEKANPQGLFGRG